MLFKTPLAVLAFMLAGIGLVAETIELDRCIGRKCHRNGRYDSVQITEQHFIVYIDADRCPGHDNHCPTSYASFTAPDGTVVDSGDYRPGERTRATITLPISIMTVSRNLRPMVRFSPASGSAARARASCAIRLRWPWRATEVCLWPITATTVLPSGHRN